MTTPIQTSLPKRPSSSISLPSTAKRPCLSLSPSSTTPPSKLDNPISIPSLLSLSESSVWSLRKSELRAYFFALQSYAQNPYPLSTTSSHPSPSSSPAITLDLPPLLRLPLELRIKIYESCLSLPTHPIRGPHPRQLQSPLLLTQRFPPALLHLNRQIHTEAVPIIYGAPSQTVHIKIDYNVWAHKTQRSPLIVSSLLTSSIRHVDLSIHLGNEKRVNRPRGADADARIEEVKKGVKKLGKWLAGAEVGTLRVSWEEPPQTFGWDVKKGVLDGLRGLRAERVVVGSINWGLDWNKGRRYRFEVGYLQELERGRQIEGGGSGGSLV